MDKHWQTKRHQQRIKNWGKLILSIWMPQMFQNFVKIVKFKLLLPKSDLAGRKVREMYAPIIV